MDGKELTQVTPAADQLIPPVAVPGQKPNPIGDLIDLLKKQKEPEKKPDSDPAQPAGLEAPAEQGKPKVPESTKPDQKGSDQAPQGKTGTDGAPSDTKAPAVKTAEPNPADPKSTGLEKADEKTTDGPKSDRNDAPPKLVTPDSEPKKSTEIIVAPEKNVKSTDTPIQLDKAPQSTVSAHRAEYVLPPYLQQSTADNALPHIVIVDEATQKVHVLQAGKEGRIDDVAVMKFSSNFAAQVRAIGEGAGQVGDKQFDSLWRHLKNDGATNIGTLYPLVKSTTPVYFVKQLEGAKIHPTADFK